MTPLGWGWAGFVWAYALAWFLLNDRIKILAYRIFDPIKSKIKSDLTPQIETRKSSHTFKRKKGRIMKINPKDFRVQHGKKVKLEKWPTKVNPFFDSKKQYQKLLEEHVETLSSLQRLHYASGHYALLLIFQGMDAAGKDGAIRHVVSGSTRKAARSSVSNSRARRN